MKAWQQEYIDTVRRIRDEGEGLSRQEARALKGRCDRLLSEELFPELDGLYGASAQDLADLRAFADVLSDGLTNLDTSLCATIYDALVSLARARRDRAGLIRELYKLGNALFFQRRMVMGVADEEADAFAFRNEMVYTEAASFLRWFEEIGDEEARGCIVRSIANIALCAKNRHRRIAASARVLELTKDERMRALAPGLPWEHFRTRTHQQMSSNRSVLSRGDLSRQELMQVLDSCYVVFFSEEKADQRNVRWLWPYYEMEYSCGYVSLEVTMGRLEGLIRSTEPGRYDVPGLYGNIQLPIYYGRLMAANPELFDDAHHLAFLNEAYERMMDTFRAVPPEARGDNFFYNVTLVISDEVEREGILSYREITKELMGMLGGSLMAKGRLAGRLLVRFAKAMLARDPACFDELPFLAEEEGPEARRQAVLSYAAECGMYADFGLIKMNLERLMRTRRLLESEERMYRLHTVSGWYDLKNRASTERFADPALGHHAYYDGSGGYPGRYERTASPYRSMTDAVAVAMRLLERGDETPEEAVEAVFADEGTRFSPLVTAALADCREAVLRELEAEESAFF